MPFALATPTLDAPPPTPSKVKPNTQPTGASESSVAGVWWCKGDQRPGGEGGKSDVRYEGSDGGTVIMI